MNIVATVFADFVQAPAGGPAQLGTRLGRRTVLEHTLRRLLKVAGVTHTCLFVRPRDKQPAEEALRAAGLEDQIELVAENHAPPGRRQLLNTARKWSLESWRGGLLGSTWFDEYVDAVAAAYALNHYGCDGLLCLDGHQAVFDPAIASEMLSQLEENRDKSKMAFTQAPPGLAGIVTRREALAELVEGNAPIGIVLTYRPEMPQYDPVIHSACYRVPATVMQTAARFVADTRRSRELIELALAELGEQASAEELCRWVASPGHERAGPLPVEVELELTTADPLPASTVRPRGERVPRRWLEDVGAVGRLAEQLAEYDDRLVFLGGHGDPLQHPRFAEVCRLLRAGGVYGIGVATPLVDLTEANCAALLDNAVDVVEVQLDAHGPADYQRVHGRDAFQQVIGNLERLEQTRCQRQLPAPLIVCSMTRCAATFEQIEAFYDHWIKTLGSVVLRGYNDYCGALPPDTLLQTTPAVRGPCRRLWSRMMLLADGTAALCAQDIEGAVRVGDWQACELRSIWSGEELAAVRRAHAGLELESLPKCGVCGEWDRP